MYHDFNFGDVLAGPARAALRVEDVVPAGAELDLSRRFMPEALARTDEIAFPSDDQKRTSNQGRGHELSGQTDRPQGRQREAQRRTCSSSKMVNPRSTATAAGPSATARDRIAAVAPAFS